MKFNATVKVLQEVKSGTSDSTGNAYKYQGVILEFADGERLARLLASLGTEQVESVQKQGIAVGSRVIVDLQFTTRVNYNKFVENKIYVSQIALASALPQPQYPQFK